MRTNVATKYPYNVVPVRLTHEGGKAVAQKPLDELTRAVVTCMLWENTFYERGSDIANRIRELCTKVRPDEIATLARAARETFKLRHVPLFLALQLVALTRGTGFGARNVISDIIKRPDELAEIVSIYWKEGKRPLAKQLKLGLADAFNKFNEYQLAKWNRQDRAVKLRDVLFLSHAKPKNEKQAELFKKLVDGTLATPDTWEVALSAGADKRETWERLLSERKLGYMALLMNLRNMEQAGVDRKLVAASLLDGAKNSKALPFRFVSAVKAAPSYSNELSEAMVRTVNGKIGGYTQIVIDVSGSMNAPISLKSQLMRWEAAAALAVLFQQISDTSRVFTFDTRLREVPNYRGLALVEGVRRMVGGGTALRESLQQLKQIDSRADRVIVVTDEQSYDGNANAWAPRSYLINVAAYKPALDVSSGWTRFSGWSERIADFISYEETGKILGEEDSD